MTDKPIRLPRKAGSAVKLEEHKKAASLTPFEKATLEKLGIEPTIQISGSIDKLIEAVIAEDDRNIANEMPVPPGTPPIVLTEEMITPVDKLTKDQRDRLAEKIKEMHKFDVELGKKRANPPPQIPGLEDALYAAETPTISTKTGDDLINVNQKSDTGAKGEVHRCPRCRFDLDKSDELDISRTDKLAWIASLYGARFKKSYYLPGAQIHVAFRTLTSNETQLIFKQAKMDVDRSTTMDIAEFITQMNQYRLALQLDSVAFVNGTILTSPIGDIKRDNAVRDIHAYVYEDVLVNESLARIIHKKFEEFQRLTEWMEANVENEDFTKEISGQS